MPENKSEFVYAPRVPVGRNALIKRINRVLAKKNQRLGTRRGQMEGVPRRFTDQWRYYVLDVPRNLLLGHVDPETLGRELGVLKPHERLVEEEAAR